MVNMLTRSKLSRKVDSQLMTQMENEMSDWRQLLYRVIATVKLLVRLRHPLKGPRETENKGNFLTCGVSYRVRCFYERSF